MIERLPLFPLATVLFPGLVLPLHIFEERYRAMLRDLLGEPEQQRFGVVRIERGSEVGATTGQRFAQVGCTAELRGVTEHPDGRFDVVAVGRQRFRLTRTDDAKPYLRADVELLPDRPGSDAAGAARHTLRLFHLYRRRLAEAGAEVAEAVEMPADPAGLSFAIAAGMLLDIEDKQRLLEIDDATLRLRAEQRLLTRENQLLNALPTIPAGQFLNSTIHPN